MRRGFVSGIAMNGAALIHDFEIALCGQTSEDVEAGLGEGKFGMATETGLFLNQIAGTAAFSGIGYGEAAGKFLSGRRLLPQNSQSSVLFNAYKLRIPVTIHLAIGTDIPHMHPAADGASLGAATHLDFRLFCGLVKEMHPGGVYLNWGSAVLLPEIFLKAVSVVRNLGVPLRPITTANFDFIQHYRPLQNVVKRPTASSNKGRSRIERLRHHRSSRNPASARRCRARFKLAEGFAQRQNRHGKEKGSIQTPMNSFDDTRNPLPDEPENKRQELPDDPALRIVVNRAELSEGTSSQQGSEPTLRLPAYRRLTRWRSCQWTCASTGPGSIFCSWSCLSEH